MDLSPGVDRMVEPHEWRWVAAVSAVILLIGLMPNVAGYLLTPAGFHFGGLVYNWQDGNSYLAKMAEGARGDWLYTVPFTSEPGEGVWLYQHYLALGHLSAWLGIDNVHLFNAARIVASAVLLFTLYGFGARFFPDPRDRRIAFWVMGLSTGFGWVALLFGALYPDLLRAETFPSLAMLANPHFPLSMAALIWLLNFIIPAANSPSQPNGIQWALYILGIIILALMQPYGLVIAGIVECAWLAYQWLRTRQLARLSLAQLGVLILLGAPYAAYVAYQTKFQPALAGWDRQNVTLSPPVWELAAAFGLVLVAAIPSAYRAMRRHQPNDILLLLWCFSELVMMYIPYLQQRRFSLALAIPFGLLAAQGLVEWRPRWKLAPFTFVLLTNLSNVVVMLLIFSAIVKTPSYLYFSDGEWNSLRYLRESAVPHSIVLASPDFGLYIPAWTAQRVIYGHPHETANARERATEVLDFLQARASGNLPYSDWSGQTIRYILIGPRERELGAPIIPTPFVPVFSDGDTTIYEQP